jgi:hypothetical protein
MVGTRPAMTGMGPAMTGMDEGSGLDDGGWGRTTDAL